MPHETGLSSTPTRRLTRSRRTAYGSGATPRQTEVANERRRLLEEHGRLYHVSHATTSPKWLHIRRRLLRRTDLEVRAITDPGEAPLSAELCLHCDPEHEVDHAVGGASRSLRDVIDGGSDLIMEVDT